MFLRVFLLSSLMFISINAETLDECKNEKQGDNACLLSGGVCGYYDNHTCTKYPTVEDCEIVGGCLADNGLCGTSESGKCEPYTSKCLTGTWCPSSGKCISGSNVTCAPS